MTRLSLTTPPAALGSTRPAEASPLAAPPSHVLARGLFAWVGLFALLVFWRWEILWSPPYWDSAMGLFAEASFLADTGFDYYRLCYEEPRFAEGGAAVYVLSIAPTLLALVMLALPGQVLLLGHLANLACVAVIVFGVFVIARRSTDSLGSALIAAALMTTPLFSAQADLVGLDVPAAAFAIAALAAMDRNRPAIAAALGVFACLIKITALVVPLALLVYWIVALLLDRLANHRSPGTLRALAVSAVAVAAVLALMSIGFRLPRSGADVQRASWGQGLAILAETRIWCPDILLEIAIVLLLAAFACVRHLQRASADFAQSLAPRAAELWRNSSAHWVALVALLGNVVALVPFYTIPRYLLLALVLFWSLGPLVLKALPRAKHAARAGLFVLITINLYNQDGRLFPSLASAGIGADDRRNGAHLERSREYLVDHQANQRAVAWLVAHAGKTQIIAPHPFPYFLSLPRLGYVETPLRGFSLNAFESRAFQRIARLAHGVPKAAICVSLDNRFSTIADCVAPTPTPADERLFSDGLVPPLVIFRPAEFASGDASSRGAFTARLWPWRARQHEAQALLKSGDAAGAVAILRDLVLQLPRLVELRLEMADALARQGKLEDADRELLALLELQPRNTDALVARAQLALAENRLELARQVLEQAQALSPRSPSMMAALALLAEREGRLDEATVWLSRAVSVAPTDARLLLAWGTTAARAGHWTESEHALTRAMRAGADHYRTLCLLGLAQSVHGSWREAIANYRQAISLRPESPEAPNNLAWLLATYPDDLGRDGAEAVRLAEPLAQRGDTTFQQLDTLAAAYAEAGRFDDAVEAAQQAIDRFDATPSAPPVVPNSNHHSDRTERRQAIAARLALYQSRTPYRETPRWPK